MSWRIGSHPMLGISLQRVLAACSVLLFACGSSEPPPSFGRVPDFALLDQRGEEVTLAALSGKIWVVDFIFTSCPDVCPLLTQQLLAVRKRLPQDPRLAFVSISVDPEHDTPEKLRAFAKQHGADHANWFFLTGDATAVKRIVTQGFKQAMQAVPEEAGKPRNVLHGTHFVLVDDQQNVRGFHRSDQAGIEQLEAAVKHLLAARSPS